MRLGLLASMALSAALAVGLAACNARDQQGVATAQPAPPAPAQNTQTVKPQTVAREGKGDLVTAAPAQVAQATPKPLPPEPAAAPTGIEGFRAKLAALENGQRKKPVVVLHIGDSHVAADSLTRNIRARLQSRFGDAGRGAVIPANAFAHASASGVTLSTTGSWRSAMSLHDAAGVYGLSGVRVDSSSPGAVMKLSAEKDFDAASVTVATGPQQGSFSLLVDGKAQTFSAHATENGAKTFEVAATGHEIEIRPQGDGDVAVLDWATTRNTPGLRYINFGQIGATARVTTRWNAAAIASDVQAIKPDLIVYGFGTNEGFDDNTDLAAYRATALKFINTLKASAPNAAIAIIGAADAERRAGGSACGDGWANPPKLAAIRSEMKKLASEIGAFYWDWAGAMGGPCAMSQWAQSGLGAPDRIHFTPKGYEAAAEKFTGALLGPLAVKPQNVAAK